MRHALLLALPVGAALLFAGCSSGARSTGSAAAEAARPAPVAPEYVASPTKHWESLSEGRRREVAAEKSAAKSRALGTAVKPASRPAGSARSFPEPVTPVAAVTPAPVSAPPAACPPKICCPPKPLIDLCPGGKCCIPPPACCDPCAGGRCGVPEPAWGCEGR
jgi:hypothetical protein